MKFKIIVGVLILSLVGTFGLMLHKLSQMNSETIILCAENESGMPIPSQLCEYYLFNHRNIRKDVGELSSGGGLIFILNGSNEAKKYKIAEFFIEHGLDVNGINHYGDHDLTPVYGAILLNDADMLRFLLKHDADLSIKPPEINMTVQEFARSLQSKEPAIDRSKILEILSGQKTNA